ncbi:hypothetical protein BY996DRAFT_4577751 [Phakopsora pachyrhizi]|uniref:Ribosomal protein S14 n=1 Tax=Phakopsora pachyrhizi TaxID=170000 RepID=A0AAV0AZW6_PHAPC|nr:hypothetical protein BY996DRAFT_4577751 [Phakopsora pachyrhizi]CAH7675999.1 hypothetical protein PPACK8108_LOCUS11100 [Phakopsora pachyrhizi]
MRSPINIRTLRDMNRRELFEKTEILRRAYLYVARNEGLPMKIRAQAQLSLNSLPTNSHPTKIHERCIITGKGRGVIAKIGLCRHQLKLKASREKWMGYEKAIW